MDTMNEASTIGDDGLSVASLPASHDVVATATEAPPDTLVFQIVDDQPQRIPLPTITLRGSGKDIRDKLLEEHLATILGLKKEHNEEILNLSGAHSDTILKLKTTHRAEILKLKNVHDAEILKLKSVHDAEMLELKITHQQDKVESKKKRDKEVCDLKNKIVVLETMLENAVDGFPPPPLMDILHISHQASDDADDKEKLVDLLVELLTKDGGGEVSTAAMHLLEESLTDQANFMDPAVDVHQSNSHESSGDMLNSYTDQSDIRKRHLDVGKELLQAAVAAWGGPRAVLLKSLLKLLLRSGFLNAEILEEAKTQFTANCGQVNNHQHPNSPPLS